jgi:uncharacterized protein
MTLVQSLLAVLSGSGVGFMLGLIGGGGSILATPLLLYVVGVASPHAAIGTGALAVAANALLGLSAHARRGHIWWRCAAVFAVTGVAGALAGSSLGKAIDGQLLLVLFSLLMVAIGILMLKPRAAQSDTLRPVDLRMCGAVGATALVTGAASGFFGIGGGFLIVPGLIMATGMPTINAVGSSLLAVAAFGLATAGNYALSGLVDWPVAGLFIAGGYVGGLLGARLSTRLGVSANSLNRVFAAVVFIVATYMLFKNLPGAF